MKQKATLFVVVVVVVVVGSGIGLPLFGWGVLDVQGFFSDPVRAAYAALIVVQAAVVGWRTWRGAFETFRSRGLRGKLVHRQRVMPLAFRLLTLVLFLVAPYCDRHGILMIPGGDVARTVGLILYVPSMVFLWWAHASLGALHSVEVTIQAGHRLITRGPYRFIRHPMYAGLLVSTLGFALIFPSWVAIASCIPAMALVLWRITDEEHLMHKEFGEQWEGYCRRSWRLIPFVL